MNAPLDSSRNVFSRRAQIAMVAMAYVPLLNVLAMATLAALPLLHVWPRWTLLLPAVWLLLVPAAVVRITLAIWPLASHDIAMGSRAFLLWWFASQWQVIFNRLPMIEEMLRLVPGMYSAWLRLWGTKVGRFVYWTPGLRILDRQLLRIGDRVSFGAGVRLNAHVILPDASGRLVLRLGVIEIGEEAMVGAYSLVLAGCVIAAGEQTPALREMRPFTRWAHGRRTREPHA